MRLRSLLLSAAMLALGAFEAGCAAPDDAEGGARSDVTNIPQTSVKEQQIGNCWIYTTVAWAESLHLSATRETLDLSESWVTYWHFFEQVAHAGVVDIVTAPGAVDEPGKPDTAFALIARYGLVEERSFRTTDPVSALRAFNAALERGDLATRGARLDAARVRRALDKAFGLTPATVAAMDAVYGRNGETPLASAPAAARQALGVVTANDFRVRLPNPTTHAPENRNLADAIGTGDDRYAWDAAVAPSVMSDRDWLKRIQRALHDGYPLPLAWYADGASMGPDQITFRPPAEGFGKGSGGWHLSLITDYGAEDVPGFGALPAGRVETRPDALAAALDDATVVSVLRVKNSWGAIGLTWDPLKLDGYSDLTRAYYTKWAPRMPFKVALRVNLPAGY